MLFWILSSFETPCGHRRNRRVVLLATTERIAREFKHTLSPSTACNEIRFSDRNFFIRIGRHDDSSDSIQVFVRQSWKKGPPQFNKQKTERKLFSQKHLTTVFHVKILFHVCPLETSSWDMKTSGVLGKPTDKVACSAGRLTLIGKLYR